MPLGAGQSPAGGSAAGYGLPDTGTVPINAILPDPSTGLPQTGRFLNPVTKDYEFTSDGRVVGTPTARQLVQLAVRTTLGSSCLPTLGFDQTGLDEKGNDYPRQVATKVAAAFAPIVAQGIVQLTDVNVQDGAQAGVPDATSAAVSWVDLTTGVQQTTNLGP